MLTLQPQETALRPLAIHAIEDLKKSIAYQDKLQKGLGKAVQMITETSTQINDRGLEERVRHNKKRNRRIANGEPENHEEQQEHDDYQSRVLELTKKMDLGIRRTIDDQIWLQDVPSTLSHVQQKSIAVSIGRPSTQFTTQHTEDDLEIDGLGEQDESQPLVQPDPSETPTALLDAAFSTNETKWFSKSLTDRYSQHNDYIGWYRMVYDANHPGEDAPPMPHASVWFASEENRDPRGAGNLNHNQRHQQGSQGGRMTRNRTNAQSDDESDIEIAAERVRITCPITLLPFKDPLASTKCPHAFEKSAILDMLKHTNEHMPFTPEQLSELSQISRTQERSRKERQMKVPMVKCPECTVPLCEQDLQPDPVLLRKVNRVLEKERRAEAADHRQDHDILDAEDDDDEDGEPPRGTQRRNLVHIGSSPAQTLRRQSGRVIKPERQSMVSATHVDE